MKNHLSLYFYDNPDPKVFYIQDVSVYNSDIDTENPFLSIMPPNFTEGFLFEYPIGKTIPINSNIFKWTNTPYYNSLSDLPDGLYQIEQSVKPNELVKKSYIYFRITYLKTKLLEKVSEQFNIQNASCFGCSKDESWYKELFEQIQWLELSKFMAETEGKCDEAKLIYNEVLKFYNKFDC